MNVRRTIIAISREFGSGGRLVGEALAQRLGIAFYDRKLIELAAEKSGLSPEFIARSEDSASSSFLFSLATNAHATNGYFLRYDIPVGDRAFFAQSSVVKELAEKESCVIVGRCAGYMLRDDPNCVSVFLHGTLDDRLERAASVYGMPRKGLADLLAKTDKSRSNYHRYYTGENWYDLRCYDLAVNTAITGIDGAVDAIAGFVAGLEKTRGG